MPRRGTEGEIATVAYQLWLDNGCPVGSDQEDWFRAEAMNLPVVFVFHRAGVTGDDGPSHHGLLDIALCLAIPNMTVFAPSTAEEVPGMLATALSMSTPTAIR